MALSRSPSPVPGGGWSSPGLNINTSGRNSPTPTFPGSNGNLWESSRTKNMGGRGYPAFETQNQGFFQRHMRRISNSLPRFNSNIHYAEKEKLQRGQWAQAHSVTLLGRLRNMTGRVGRKWKMRLLLVSLLFLAVWVFYHSRMSRANPILLESGYLLTCHSFDILLATHNMAWWWKEVCHHTRSERGRRCDGVEGRERVGYRTRQYAQQTKVCEELGL